MKWLLVIPCLVYAAPITPNNELYNVNRNWNAKSPSEYYGEWPSHTYHQSPNNWEEQIIYHILIDRFRDGDPRNNELAFSGYNPRSINMRHGGDFKGVTEKLDYLKELGVTALWLSPIFQTPENEYHGYGQIDFTLLDQRFGTLEELRSLINEAHKRGIYVLVDVIVNHSSHYYAFKGHENSYAPFKMHKGEYEMVKRFNDREYEDFSFNNTWDPDGLHCPVYDYRGIRVESQNRGTFSKSDFYHNGNLDDFNHPFSNAFGSIYGKYNDLRLCAPHVAKKVIAMTKSLIASTDIDGIRLDTPMQVPNQFLKEWSSEIKAFAKTLGKNDFLVLGETYARRPQVAPMIRRGKDSHGNFLNETPGLDGGLNYPLFIDFILPRFWGKESIPFDAKKFRELELKAYDLYDPISKTNRYLMANFSESHDQRRLNSLDSDLGLLSYVFLSFSPGLPVIYQGQEQGFDSFGSGLEGNAREPMMENLWWKSRPSRTIPNKAAKDNFDMNSHYFRCFSLLNSIRRELVDTKNLFSQISSNTDNTSSIELKVPLKDGSLGIVKIGKLENSNEFLKLCGIEYASFASKIKKPFITATPEHDSVISADSILKITSDEIKVFSNKKPFFQFEFTNNTLRPNTNWPLGLLEVVARDFRIRYRVEKVEQFKEPKFVNFGSIVKITPSKNGAEFFRVKDSDWKETSTFLEVPALTYSSLQEIEIQYWRDGSSALFETLYLDNVGGHDIERGSGFKAGIKQKIYE